MYGCETYRKDCNEILENYQKKVTEIKNKQDLLVVKNANKTLQIIENPLINFEEYFQYVESLNLNQDGYHKLRRNVMFPSGGSVKAWIVAVFELCQSGKIKEQEIVYKVYLLYEKFVMVPGDDLARSMMRLSFFLGYDEEQLADFLQIKLFMVQKLRKRKEPLKERIFNKLLEVEKKYDRSAFESWQLAEIERFFVAVKACDYERKEKKPKVIDKVKENKPKEITFEGWLNYNGVEELKAKLLEIKEYLKENKLGHITNDARFSDGSFINVLLRKFIHFNNTPSPAVPVEIKEYLASCLAEITELLFENKKVMVNEESSLNYGGALDKVLYSFDLSYIDFFERTQIPGGVISKVCRNEILPSQAIVSKILSLLDELEISTLDTYQKEILEQTRVIYKQLACKIDDKKGQMIYKLYSEEQVLEFEKSLENDTANLALAVKNSKYDWYLKWLTFYQICSLEKRRPNKNEYFYDGTIAFKWINTQRDTLESNNGCVELSKEQKALVELLLTKINELNYQRQNSEELRIINDFDNIFSTFLNKLGNGEDLLNGLAPDDASNWNLLQKMVLSGKWFDDEHVLKVRKLRNLAIINHYADNHVDNYKDSFGFKLTSLMDAFDVSIAAFSNLTNSSVGSIVAYRQNYSTPTVESVEKMEEVLSKLQEQVINIDQQYQIIAFADALSKMKMDKRKRTSSSDRRKYLQNFDQYVYGETGEAFVDINDGIFRKIKENNSEWYQNFVDTFEALKKSDGSLYEKKGYLNKFKWYLTAMRKLNKGRLSYEQIVLLKYLVMMENKNKVKSLNEQFDRRFAELENFIDVNNRIPKYGETKLDDDIDAYLFYRDLRNKHWGVLPTRFTWLNDEQYIKVKNLLIKVTTIQYGLEQVPDYRDGDQFYVGNALSRMRLSLGCSSTFLPNFFKLPEFEVIKIYKNERPLSRDELISILSYLSNLPKDKLRRDQLVDVNNFYNLLGSLENKKNNELSYLLGKKN